MIWLTRRQKNKRKIILNLKTAQNYQISQNCGVGKDMSWKFLILRFQMMLKFPNKYGMPTWVATQFFFFFNMLSKVI